MPQSTTPNPNDEFYVVWHFRITGTGAFDTTGLLAQRTTPAVSNSTYRWLAFRVLGQWYSNVAVSFHHCIASLYWSLCSGRVAQRVPTARSYYAAFLDVLPFAGSAGTDARARDRTSPRASFATIRNTTESATTTAAPMTQVSNDGITIVFASLPRSGPCFQH
jgi:hypothetical protein